MDKRGDRDAARRRRAEIDHVLQQLDICLSAFDAELEQMADDGHFEGRARWEALSTLQKKKAALETLRKQSKEDYEDVRVAVREIDDRIRLNRGLVPRKSHAGHGVNVDRAYHEAREWMSTMIIRLHLAASRVFRESRRKAQAHSSIHSCHGRVSNKCVTNGYGASVDADDRQVLSRMLLHRQKMEKMRDLLDRERVTPEDVLSIQPDFDQCISVIEDGGCVDDTYDWVWDCIDLDGCDYAEDSLDTFGVHDTSRQQLNDALRDYVIAPQGEVQGTPSKQRRHKAHRHSRSSVDNVIA